MVLKELKYGKTNDRKLVVLRGVAGVGKSTFIKDRGLEDYSISQDMLRNVISSPVHTVDNEKVIDNSKNNYVFKLFHEMLERRLSNGVFTIIDNTNTDIQTIRTAEEKANMYGYDMYVINFEEDTEVLLERNNKRKGTTKYFTSTKPLYRMIDTFTQNNDRIKQKYNVIDSKDEEKLSQLFDNQYINLDNYKEVKVIGDIHGSYTVLNEAIPTIEEDTFYIFLGDYIDRGTKNHEVLDFLLKNYKKDNVVLLEGNHEIYLRAFTNSVELGYGREFKDYTKKELIEKRTPLKSVKKMMKKLKSKYLFEYKGKKYVCTHGGVLPTNYNFLHHEELIRGVGGYEFNVDKRWEELSDGEIQFHGHRNKLKVKPHKYKTSYNLEGRVDSGGFLRVATIRGTEVKVSEYLNTDVRDDRVSKDAKKVEGMLEYANNTEDIRVKEQPYKNNVSVNFGHKFFSKRQWDKDSVKARGLFLDIERKKVVMRGYEKFFNLGEMKTIEETANDFNYPIVGYKKENGYLGLLSYSETEDDLMFGTKSVMINSTDDSVKASDMAKEFRRIFYNTLNEEQLVKVEEYLRMKDNTLVFEVISFKDKHITNETEEGIVLLDSIKNEITFQTKQYGKLVELVEDINSLGHENKLKVKKKALTFKTKEKFLSYLNSQNNFNIEHEGFVFVDETNNFVKYKSEYYSYWKYFRASVDYIMRREDDFYKVVQSIKARNVSYIEKNDYLDDSVKQVINLVSDNIEEYIMKHSDFLFENVFGHTSLDVPKTAHYFMKDIN